jgi:ferritin-like metal-binding protein YciE
MEADVRELLIEELKDAYSAEKQALRCMQKVLRMVTAPALRQGIELHIEQTQTQIDRVEQAMEKLETRPGRKVCEAMRGLVEEAQHAIGEQDGKWAAFGSGHRRRHAADRALRNRRLWD